MKKIITILFLAVSSSVMFTACSDDDATPTAELTGKWELFQEGTLVNGQEVFEAYEHASGCAKDNLEFLAGGVFKSNFYDNFFEPCELYSVAGNWTKDGNNLTITVLGEIATAEILILDATTLKIRYVDEEDGETYIDILKRATN
jgi:hypothetical protein